MSIPCLVVGLYAVSAPCSAVVGYSEGFCGWETDDKETGHLHNLLVGGGQNWVHTPKTEF